MSGYAASRHIGRPEVRAVIAPVAPRRRPAPIEGAAASEPLAPATASADAYTTLPPVTAVTAVTAVAVDLVAPEPGRLARVREEVVVGWRQTTFFLFSAEGWR